MSNIHEIKNAVNAGTDQIHVGGIFGPAKAYLIAKIIETFSDKTILVLSPTSEQAKIIKSDINLFLTNKKTWLFPDSDVLPYLKLSPEPTIWADRLEILFQLLRQNALSLVASIPAATRAVPPKSFLSKSSRTIKLEDTIDRNEIALWLSENGYVDVGLVEDEGSFAIRGSIIDLWTPTIDWPIRIELDGDKVCYMRLFDPATQRSRKEVRETIVLPASDICFSKKMTDNALENVRKRADEKDFPTQEKRRVLEMIRENIMFEGIETLATFFHNEMYTLLDYLPDNALVIIDEPEEVTHAAAAHIEEISELAKDSSSVEKLVSPEELYKTPKDLFSDITQQKLALRFEEPIPNKSRTVISVSTEPITEIRSLISKQSKEEKEPLSPLFVRFHTWKSQNLKPIFVCHTDIQAERLDDLLKWHGIGHILYGEELNAALDSQSLEPGIVVGRLSEGFKWPDEKLLIITDEHIFGRKIHRRITKGPPVEHFTSFAELAKGDALVHENHGVGRYMGLKHLSIQGTEGDYLLLEYLGGDRLYVPVYRMNLVQKYVGAGEGQPALDKLGGTKWSKLKANVRKAIMAMAKDLLKIQAAREMYPGFKFPEADTHYEEFCATFPYDETPDQETAINDVLKDMEIEKPMDRLICGDVGYGKTEVAMRAAFKAAMAGKQVAILVPTTILALQHYETFSHRFSKTPIKVEMLSRFRKTKQQKEIIADVGRGTIDIIIGTHRLISKDVEFNDLGLLIIDEEQRFGVKHKEKLKKIKHTLDVISLTATPIPRTLNLSLVGIRDISTINTPPADRHSITTHVVPFDEVLIRHAILNEINRGGQIFFVHNRIQTMPSMLARLRSLVPEARIEMAHGQMSEGKLEDVMIDFLEKRFNVLLCTAIIESGLDIPSANTIIVNRADTFGLAQLYQLRGRVGRSDVFAYAYLLTPKDAPITPDAKKRLVVLKRFTALGSGFQIASHDLEIRGSGNILGASQSGHISQVGYELYTKLLARTIRKLSGKPIYEEIDPELKLKVKAYFPNTYISEAGTRLECYRRLANCDNEENISDIMEEIKDRFGPIPEEAKRLVEIMKIKIMAQKLCIKQITFDGKLLSSQLDPRTTINPTRIANLAADDPNHFRLYPPDRIICITGGITDPDEILIETRNFLSTLLSYANSALSKD